MLGSIPFAAKLFLTLILVVIIAVIAVGVLANLWAEQHFAQYLSDELQPRIAAVASEAYEHYRAQGSWEGAEDILSSSTGRGRGMGGPGFGIPLALTDNQGNVVSDPDDLLVDRQTANQLEQVPIVVDGETVGTLYAGRSRQQEDFSSRLKRSIIGAALLATLVALLLGLAIILPVMRNLRHVTEAARQVASGDLTQRVPVTTRDEIGQLAEQFNHMAASLERNQQLRRRLMADIAHELRNPMSVMRGHLEALLDGVFEPTPENLTPVYDQTLLLERLVNDLRDLALAEAQQLPLELTETDLAALVHRTARVFQTTASSKGLTLHVAVEESPLTVQIDPQRTEQIIANLLSNAVRHTPGGGNITVGAKKETEHAVVWVQDTGEGIDAEHLPHIFDRFYRVDQARSRSTGGTGLGLAIAKQLVEAQKGTIAVASEPGEGTTFSVRFPLHFGGD